MPQTVEEEDDLRLKHDTGALELLDDKTRERVMNTHDRQLERAYDLLKGVLLYSQHNSGKMAEAAK